MKKQNSLTGILIGLIMFSCSTDDGKAVLKSSNPIISKWIYKRYTFYENNGNIYQNGILTDSIEYLLDNNKIISFSGLTDINKIPKTVIGNLKYSNDKISEMQRYVNNQNVHTISYNYDSSGELNEFKSKYWDSYSQELRYYKSEYTHTTDTIFSTNYSSTNDIQYLLETKTKQVFDNNQNRIYYENNYNEDSNFAISTYDTSNNMIINNINNSTTIYNYSYSSIINSEAIIHNSTFGKKVNMITNGAGIAFFPTTISYNTLENIEKNRGSNSFDFGIEIEANQDNYSVITLYKETVNEIPNNQIISEFIFE